MVVLAMSHLGYMQEQQYQKERTTPHMLSIFQAKMIKTQHLSNSELPDVVMHAEEDAGFVFKIGREIEVRGIHPDMVPL